MIESIAKVADELDRLVEMLKDQDFEFVDDVDWNSARLMFARESEGHLVDVDDCQLDNSGLVDDTYYVHQKQGILDDEYYGEIYFPTYNPTCWVVAKFECF